MHKSIPERWEAYKPIGRRIKGTRFIAFKVPLKESLCMKLSPQLRFGLDDLLSQCPDIGMIVDLTMTARYYNTHDVVNKGVAYCKIACPGQVIPPEPLVKRFFSAVDTYLEHHQEDDTLIGIHCTHGVNRSGYMLGRYLMQRMGWSHEDAVKWIGDSRGHPMEREKYVRYLTKQKELVPKVLDSSDIIFGQLADASKQKGSKVRGLNSKRPVGNPLPDKYKGGSRGRGVRDYGRRGGKFFHERSAGLPRDYEEPELQEEYDGVEEDRYKAPRRHGYNPEQYHEEDLSYEPQLEEHHEEDFGSYEPDRSHSHNREQGKQYHLNAKGRRWETDEGNGERDNSNSFNRNYDQQSEEHGNHGRFQHQPRGGYRGGHSRGGQRGGYRGGYHRGGQRGSLHQGANRYGFSVSAPQFQYGNDGFAKPLPVTNEQTHHAPPRHPPPTHPLHHSPQHGSRDRTFSPPSSSRVSEDHRRPSEQWADSQPQSYDHFPRKNRGYSAHVANHPSKKPMRLPVEPTAHALPHQYNSPPHQRRGRSVERKRASPSYDPGTSTWNGPSRHESPPFRSKSPHKYRRMESPTSNRAMSPPRRLTSPHWRPTSPPHHSSSPPRRPRSPDWSTHSSHRQTSPRTRHASPPEPRQRVSSSPHKMSTYGRERYPYSYEQSQMSPGSHERVAISQHKRKISPPLPPPPYHRAPSPPRRLKSPPSRAHQRSPSPYRSMSPGLRRKGSPPHQKITSLSSFQRMTPPPRSLDPPFYDRGGTDRSSSPPHKKSMLTDSRELVDGRQIRKDGRGAKEQGHFEDHSRIPGALKGRRRSPSDELVRSQRSPKRRLPNSSYDGVPLSSAQSRAYKEKSREISPDMPLSKSPNRFVTGNSDWRYGGVKPAKSSKLSYPSSREEKDPVWRGYERESFGSRSFSPPGSHGQSGFHGGTNNIPMSRSTLKSDPLINDCAPLEKDCRAIILQKRLASVHDGDSDHQDFDDLVRESRAPVASRLSPKLAQKRRQSPTLMPSPSTIRKDVANRLPRRGSPDSSHSKKPVFERLDAKKPPVFERLETSISPKKVMDSDSRLSKRGKRRR